MATGWGTSAAWLINQPKESQHSSQPTETTTLHTTDVRRQHRLLACDLEGLWPKWCPRLVMRVGATGLLARPDVDLLRFNYG